MLLQFLCLLCMINGVLSGCSIYYGPPAGKTECIAHPLYGNQYQRARCLSNADIKIKSGHRHECLSGPKSVKFCYYQCMIEVHDQKSGNVTSDCSCLPGSKPPKQLNATAIPWYKSTTQLLSTAFPWYSPTTNNPEKAEKCINTSSDSCDWYPNCLRNKTYPCEDKFNGYAITYAEKFCTLNEKNKLAWFSSKGQQWINAVRKCLQVSLVPLLRPYAWGSNVSCQKIRQVAFDSHAPCYLHPDKDAPSVCDLECSEFFKIFYALKRSFGKMDMASWESLKGLWNIEDRCGMKCSRSWLRQHDSIKILKLRIPSFKESHDYIVQLMVSAIAKEMKWNSEVMDWFAYLNATSQSIYIILADKKAFTPPFKYLTKTIKELASRFEKSKLPLQLGIESLDVCYDKACTKSKSLVITSTIAGLSDSGGKAMVENGCLVGFSLLIQSLTLWWSNKLF